MYFRIATKKRGDKQYQSLHLVESYRTKEGKVRQRIVVNFGPAHPYRKAEVAEMIRALSRFFHLSGPEPEVLPPEGSQDFGGTYAIFRIWEELGWEEALGRYLKRRRHEFDVIANLKALVANRLLDPMAKLHILDWMEGVHLCGMDRDQIDYNHLLRAMDVLIEHKEELEPRLVSRVLTLFDQSLDLVFYDLTSCYFEINGQDKDDKNSVSTLRNYGYDRDRSGCPQVVLGLVMTQDGIPLCHHVFSGETTDKSTLRQVIGDIKARFPVKRCIVVGDRGLLSEENLEALTEADLDYIVSRPLRHNRIAQKAMEGVSDKIKEARRIWEKEKTPLSEQNWYTEATIDGRRLVLSHTEEIARQSRKGRQGLLSQATLYIKWRVAKTAGQHDGTLPVRGKALSWEETLLNIHDYLRDRKLSRYYRIGLDERGRVQWEPLEESRRWENQIDGKLLLETTNHSLTPQETVHQYKELQDIERCFRTLKSSLDIRPVYHWVDRRIKAHIFICVMALQIQRLMRHRLHQAKINRSPERVLEKLSFQRTVEATANGKKIQGLVPATAEQLNFYKALNILEPQYKNLSARTM